MSPKEIDALRKRLETVGFKRLYASILPKSESMGEGEYGERYQNATTGERLWLNPETCSSIRHLYGL